MKPKFKHHCDKCEYVWTVDGIDWYVCPNPDRMESLTSILGRYAEPEADYYSYHPFLDRPPVSSTMAMAQATFLKWREAKTVEAAT
jgi:hypothetical protein